MSARSASRGIAAVVGLLLVLVAVPALLVDTSAARFGHASPLHGMDAPWRWTLDGARSWWHRLTDQLDTSGELIDVFVRVALVLAWLCVAVVVVTLIGEVVYQLRHGMPSSGRSNVLGLAWLGRVVAGGLLALLPMASAAPALAGGPAVRQPVASSVMPRTVAPAGVARSADPGTVVAAPQEAPATQPWGTYVVQRGDSVWSIASAIAGSGGDVGATAAQIVDANRGATMADGRRFTTPALIEPGWQLSVPGMVAATPAPVASDVHVVEAGDSYWRIAADHLAATGAATPTDGEVLAETRALIDLNAPLLGHDDPHLLLPGETVVLGDPAVTAAASDAAVDPPAADPSASDTPVEAADVPLADTASVVVTTDPASTDAPPAAPDTDTEAADVPVADTAPVVVDAVPGTDPVVVDAVPDTAPVVVDVAPDTDPVVVDAAPPVATDADPAAIGAEPTAAETVTPPVGAPADAAAPGAGVVVATVASADAPATAGSDPEVVADATSEVSGATSLFEVGLGGSALFATGVLGILEARRRARLRAATLGQRLPDAPSWEAATERELRSVAQPERVARLDVALRVAAPALAAQQARLVAVEAANTGELRLTADRPAVPPAGPWVLDADGGTWVLAARWSLEDLATMAHRAVAPCPALAHVGSTDRGQLYVDLEAIGLLAVDLPEPMASDVLRCMAASVALSPLAGGIQLVTVGLPGELPSTSSASVEEAGSLDAALEVAAAFLGSTRVTARGTSTFALRAQGVSVETWDPVVVIATDDGGDGIDAARSAAGDGLAIVVGGSVESAEWRVEIADDRVVLMPLGVALTPCGLSVGALADVNALLRAAVTPLELRARVVALPSAGRSSEIAAAGEPDDDAAALDVEPPWSLLVRLFGRVEVVGPDGEVAPFERSKALELVAWLAQHRRRPTRTAARTALWDVDVRDATFANVVSDARRAMARTVAPPAGQEWLARTLTEELPLHDGVVTDADLIELRVAAARRQPAGKAMAILRPAVELLDGMPFAGTSYLWSDAEGLTSSLTLLGVGAALQMARTCLDVGDVDGVFWSTGKGLQVLAGHEELLALRMQAHASVGDLAGVRHEWAAYERALDADPWSAATPSPKLVALRHRLLSAPGSAVG